MLLLPATTAPGISPSSSTGIPAFPLCIYLEKQTTPLPPQDRTDKLYRGNTEGPSPSRTSHRPPPHREPHTGPPKAPAGPRGGSAKSRPQLSKRSGGVGSADGQTDHGTAPLPGSPLPWAKPPGGGRSRGGAAGQHECWRRRHRGARDGDEPGGSAGGPRHSGPAALQGKCWETWGTQASRNKLRKINQKGNCGVGSTSPCPPAAGSAGDRHSPSACC